MLLTLLSRLHCLSMVEPLASLVKGSIGRYPALQAASKSARATRKRNTLPSSFFTPAPRQHRCSTDSKPGGVTQCQEWSSCSLRHSLGCSSKHLPSCLVRPNLDTRAPRQRPSLGSRIRVPTTTTEGPFASEWQVGGAQEQTGHEPPTAETRVDGGRSTLSHGHSNEDWSSPNS